MTWICLVDDHPDVRDVLTELLRSAGHGVLSFRDGSDALEGLYGALETPRLVILDNLLVGMTGRQVLERIRLGHRAANVPVLIVTGMDIDASYFAPWPVEGVLRKPVAAVELLARVAEILDRGPPRGR